MAKAKKTGEVIEQPNHYGVTVEIEGTQPLIQNAFSQKALEQMLRKHMGLSNQKEAKKPRECIEQATIRNVKGEVSIPPTAIKKAMLSAAATMKSFKKTHLRTQIFIHGGSIPIKYEKMVPRMDMVRTSGIGRTPDVRFRPSFEGWSARLYIQFSDPLDARTIVDLVNRAGKVGVGEWRPEKDGSFGTYFVSRVIDSQDEIKEVLTSCEPGLVQLTIPEWAMDAEITPDILSRIGAGVSGDVETSDDSEEAAE